MSEPSTNQYTDRIVGIRFRAMGRVYDYDAKEFKFSRGDKVVCDFPDKGLQLGYVSKPTISISSDDLKLQLPTILRPANHNDIKTKDQHIVKEKDSLIHFKKMVERRNLGMRIIDVEIPLHGKKALVYFSAEDRVDFRELIKDMTGYLNIKVELKQLGSRDETKHIGGLGPCGQETCCSRFLNKFHSVNIKMAKDQGLSLTPTKVSGNCGRLKCCLAYEQPVYAEARKTLPKLGNCVKCSNGGCGTVTKLDLLKKMVTVRFDDGTTDTVPADRIVEKDTLRSAAAKKETPSEEPPIDESQLED